MWYEPLSEMAAEPGYTTYLAVLLLASLSIVTTLLGVALALYIGRNERAIAISLGFSAGIMLLLSFLELIPAAIYKAGTATASLVFMLGMLIVAALQWMIPQMHLGKERDMSTRTLIKTAYLVAFSLILHDVPEGFAMAVPIVMIKKRRFLYAAAFMSSLAEPLGAVIGLVAVHFHPLLNPLFMAFTAGAMVFVSLHELLPIARRYHKISLFILGALISVLVYVLLTALIPG